MNSHHFIKCKFIIGSVLILSVIGFIQKDYASEILIGIKVESVHKIFQKNLIDAFVHSGFTIQEGEALGGLIFSKKAKTVVLVILKVDIVNTKNGKKLILSVTDVHTGATCFFESYELYSDNENEILKRICDIIPKIEKLKSDDIFCKKMTVTLTGDKPAEKKAGILYEELKKMFIMNNNISYIDISLPKYVVEFQDWILANKDGYDKNIKIVGHMCLANISCHVISEGGDKLNITLVRAEDQQKLNNVTISSEDDIKKLIAEILKYEKSKP